MAEVQDYELLKSPHEPTTVRTPDRPFWPWLAGAALLAAIALAVYVAAGRTRTPPSAPVVQRAATPAATRPLGGEAAAIDVPPLAETDPLVRELVRQITSHPRIAAWLATDGLIRAMTVGIENVAGGSTPAARFRVFRPAASFETITREKCL